MSKIKNYQPKLTETETMEIVLDMARIFSDDLMVDVIPHEWYKHLRYEKSGLPHLPAIIVLADICYWWRPKKEEVEAGSGVYGKRFAADRLQRRRGWYTKNKGLTKRQVSIALEFLKGAGLIEIDYETITLDYGGGDERTLNNAMYITPNAKRIAAITPLSLGSDRVSHRGERGVTSKLEGCHIEVRGVSPGSETNTESTETKNSKTEISSSREREDALSKKKKVVSQICHNLSSKKQVEDLCERMEQNEVRFDHLLAFKGWFGNMYKTLPDPTPYPSQVLEQWSDFRSDIQDMEDFANCLSRCGFKVNMEIDRDKSVVKFPNECHDFNEPVYIPEL